MGAEASKGWKEVGGELRGSGRDTGPVGQAVDAEQEGRADPGAAAGGLLTCVHDWPFQVNASPFVPLLPRPCSSWG